MLHAGCDRGFAGPGRYPSVRPKDSPCQPTGSSLPASPASTPHYVNKAGRKTRSTDEVDQVICWLPGYDAAGLDAAIAEQVDL